MSSVNEFRQFFLKQGTVQVDLDRIRKRYVRMRGKLQEADDRPVWTKHVFIPVSNMLCYLKPFKEKRGNRQRVDLSLLSSKEVFSYIQSVEDNYRQRHHTDDTPLTVGWFPSYYGYAAYCLALWELSRPVYRLHPRLTEEIMGMECPMNLPLETLLHLKDWCAYIEIPDIVGDQVAAGEGETVDWKAKGAFVHYDRLRVTLDDVDHECTALHIANVLAWRDTSELSHSLVPIVIPLISGYTLGDVCRVTSSRLAHVEGLSEPIGFAPIVFGPSNEQLTSPVCQYLINALLWMMARPSDQLTLSGIGCSKVSVSRKLKDWVVDVPLVNQEVLVGSDAGERLSATDSQLGISNVRGCRSLRTHSRAGHWRNVWYGPFNSPDRQCKPVWIAPTLVRGSDPHVIS
jgi:hypothetical protein